MFFKDNSLEAIEKKVKELSIQKEVLDREIETFLGETGLDIETISKYLENPDHFSKEVWEEIKRVKESQKESMQQDLEKIRKSDSAKERLLSLRDSHNWMPVR